MEEIEKLIRDSLFSMKDSEYAAFQAKIIPNVDAESVIGVRTPDLRKLAKDLAKKASLKAVDLNPFFEQLPHAYFEEYQLHSFLIGEQKDFDTCINLINAFLPYVNNWATCDQLNSSGLKKNKARLLSCIDVWLASGKTYTVRFGIKMLMSYFLDDGFSVSHLQKVCAQCRPHIQNADDNYYVNMMVSWYFATALAKQWTDSFVFIGKGNLNEWCLKKTVQKACESFRVPEEHKAMLRQLL